ncbi:MAG TPA: restriction endonuclease subunit S [Kiritimatiellia bacterium]|nr:restriction endonuclease subunit S [Kiritimatiellia bacterium]
MSGLPANWKRVSLAESIDIDTRQVLPSESPATQFNYIALENIESGTGQLINLRPVQGATILSGKFRFDSSHVLFGKLRPYLNKVVLPDRAGICSTDILPLKPQKASLSREWLALCLRSPHFIEYSRTKMDGAKMPRLRTPDLQSYEIPVPPLAEQRRIVARIEELTRRADEARKLRQAAVDKVRGIFQTELERVFLPSETDYWNEYDAREVFDIVKGQVNPLEEPYASMPHIAPDVMEVGTGRLFLDKARTAKELELKSGKYLFDDSHVLYSKIRPNLRKVALPDFSGTCSADMYPLIPNTEVVTKEFLALVLLSPPFTAYAVENSDRNAMPKINRATMFGYRVKLPEKPEQQAIVSRLHTIQTKTEEIIKLQNDVDAELTEFQSALLAKAFRGEL